MIPKNPNTLGDLIERFPDKHWDWDSSDVSRHVSLEFVEKHPDYPWCWQYILSRASVEFIIKYKHTWINLMSWGKDHTLRGILGNKRITEDFVYEHIDIFANQLRSEFNYNIKRIISKRLIVGLIEKNGYSWTFYDYSIAFSRHAPLSLIIETKDEFDWNWSIISEKNCTYEDVKAHPDLPWDWSALSRNQTLTYEDIVANSDKLDWSKVTKNTFAKTDMKRTVNRKLIPDLFSVLRRLKRFERVPDELIEEIISKLYNEEVGVVHYLLVNYKKPQIVF